MTGPPIAQMHWMWLAFSLVLVEGYGLQAGWGRVLDIGVPIRRRQLVDVTVVESLPMGRGPCAVTLSDGRVAFWSNAVRYGRVRQGDSQLLSAVGVVLSGTITQRDGVVRVVDRLRLGPIALSIAAAHLAATHVGFAFPVALAFFGTFYALMASVSWATHTHAHNVVLGRSSGPARLALAGPLR